MTSPNHLPHAVQQSIRRRIPRRRDDSGLTTLEWLLIVAAVAGLAALAVVLVQRVVGDTSEQIAGSSARKTAAEVAALEVTDKARAETATSTNTAGDATSAVSLNAEYKSDCKLIGITYGDVPDLKVYWHTNITTDPFVATADDDVAMMSDWNDTPKTFGCIVP